jgi:hypothetical protein
MNDDDRILAIFKFGERSYIDDFISGHLHMNTLAYFANSEASEVRHDKFEGNSYWVRGDLQIEINGKFHSIPGLTGPLAYSGPNSRDTNVFCMYAFLASRAGEPISNRVLAFGDTFALLRDFDEFLRRVRLAAEKVGCHAQCELVEYVDSELHEGRMGPFRKASQFSYQSECRIALLPGTGSACPLNVGDLSDITIVGPTADLNRRIRVE